jgi:microcystin-dependent protein
MAINREDWVRSVVPAGTVIAFAGATPPTGWLLCNGSTINRSAYPALFTAISVAHGSGDGSTTFHLPDYQGRFLRGVANGSANDPDRAARTHPVTGVVVGDAVGSVQADANSAHIHTMATETSVSSAFSSGTQSIEIINISPFVGTVSSQDTGSTGTESRPKNANVNYIIKA